MNITLNIDKVRLLRNSVAMLTAYTGAKMASEETPDTLDHVGTVDEDDPVLMQYFDECRTELAKEIGYAYTSEDNTDTAYSLGLKVYDTFNTALLGVTEQALYNYFLYGILGRWYMLTNKGEAEAYLLRSAGCLDEVKSGITQKVFTRKMYPNYV